MVNPIDYMNYMPKPNLAQNFMQGLQVGEGIQSIRDKRAAQEQMQAKHEAFQTDLRETLNNPTQGRFRNLMALYPEMGKHLAPVSESFSEERKKNEQKLAIETTTMIEGGREDLAMENLRTAIEARKNSGIDPKEYKLHQQALSALESGNIKLAQGLLNTGAAILSPDDFIKMTEGQVSASTKGDQIEAERLGNLKTRADINLSQAQARTAGQPDTVVNVGGETYDKEMAKVFAEQYKDSNKSVKASREALSNFNVLESTLSNPAVIQGQSGESILAMKKVAKRLGFDVNGVADTELANSIRGKLTVNALSDLSGAASDKDVEEIKQTIAGISNSREANLKLIQLGKLKAKRDLKENKELIKYMKSNNGRLDLGFDDVREKLNNEYISDVRSLVGLPEQQVDQGATSNASGSSNVNTQDNSIYSDEEIMSLING